VVALPEYAVPENVLAGIPVSEHLFAGIPVSEHLFVRRATATPRLTDDAEATGSDFDPILGTEGQATA